MRSIECQVGQATAAEPPGQPCETNPIARRKACQDHGRRHSCQTKPIWSSPAGSREPMVPNEPNSGGPPVGSRGRAVRNKANWQRSPKFEVSSRQVSRWARPRSDQTSHFTIGQKLFVRNEPNLAAPTGPTKLAGAVAIGAKYAKQTQLGRRQGEGQVLCGKGIMTNRTCKEHGKNKANSGRSFQFEGCRGRPPCLPIRRAATGGRPYTSHSNSAGGVRTYEHSRGRPGAAIRRRVSAAPASHTAGTGS